jgi:hypothetical protein
MAVKLCHVIRNIMLKDNFIGQLSDIQSAEDINLGLSRDQLEFYSPVSPAND